MKHRILYLAVLFSFFLPGIVRAQNTGKIECPRAGGYVYLYSSIATLDVRTTLQCGEQVQITKRYDSYYAVVTGKGDAGFVPLDSVVLLKGVVGPKLPQAAPKTARPRISYDDPSTTSEAPSKPTEQGSEFTLRNATPVHLKLSKPVSSATAHLGDKVELEVSEDVAVDGVVVIAKGALAEGSITEVEQRKRMGHGAKLGILVNSAKLLNGGNAALRGYQESNSGATGATTLVSGKEAGFVAGAEFTASVDGDIRLKREAFNANQ